MLISQHINFSRLNNKQHKAQASCLCLGKHVCSERRAPSQRCRSESAIMHRSMKWRKNPSILHLKRKHRSRAGAGWFISLRPTLAVSAQRKAERGETIAIGLLQPNSRCNHTCLHSHPGTQRYTVIYRELFSPIVVGDINKCMLTNNNPIWIPLQIGSLTLPCLWSD